MIGRAGMRRRGRPARRWLVGLLLVPGLAACATAREPAPAPDPVGDLLAGASAQCTAATGYDPDSADTVALGSFALGDGEMAWRECLYQAVTDLVRPGLIQPQRLDAIIATDRRMTAAIAAGEATRAERERTIEAMVAGLQAQEASLRAATDPGEDAAAALRPDPRMERLRRELDVLHRLIR